MESFRLNSKVVEDDKEYLVQTVNDVKEGIIRTSLFADGELLDASIMPHSEEASESDVLNLVKSVHGDKKSELENLLRSYKKVMEEGRPEMMFHLGTALFYKRMYHEGRQLFLGAVRIKHDYHEAYYYLAQVELSSNHVDAATKAALKAAELRPNFADYRNALGEAYLAAESCKRAVPEFEEAIRQNIYYADAYFNLAIAYVLNAIRKEDFNLYPDLTSKTMDLLKKALLIHPSFKTSTYDDAVQALAAGDLKRTLALLKGVREQKKEVFRQEKAAYFHRFLMYTDWLSLDNIAEQIRHLEMEIDRNPGYVDLYYDLAVCYLHQSKFSWQRSIDYFKTALEINPALSKAQKSLDLSEEHFLRLNDAIFDITAKSH